MNTPRTNALLDDMNEGYPDRWIVSHTRLERELAAAIEQRDKAVEALKNYVQHVDKCGDNESIDCICGYITAMKECGK